MRQYYIAEGSTPVGPMTLDDLRQKKIAKETLVWSEGMTDWTQAGDIVELSTLFEEPAPMPAQQPTPQPQPQAQPKPQRSATEILDPSRPRNNVAPQPGYAPRQQQYGQQPYQQQRPYQQQQQQPYGSQQQPYGQQPYAQSNPGNPGPYKHDSKQALAIVTIVLGLFSCVGLILGIVALIRANKANDEYAAGNFIQAQSDNKTAELLCYIGLGLSGLSLFILSLFNPAYM